MKNITLNDKAEQDFLVYAKAVIKSRAISNVEDNLKPVHRRILYAMDSLGLDANKKPKKSARVVGDVIGKYHPHGDFSVYQAMIRMAQPWKMRYPLIEIQGNMGNIDGDKAAAMRYTETKLSKIGELMLKDIDKNAVPFRPNYDDSDIEPIFLPSVFPNILCNGNSGIAVGMSTDMVPHNLKEVVDAIKLYLDFKNISIPDLMKVFKGPDFPTGGSIADPEKLLEIYKNGVGTVTLRAKYNIEQKNGKTSIIFTEIPYLVKVEEGIIEPIKKLVNEENFELIEDFENNTDKNGISLKIILAKGANVYRVLEALWKNTRLQVTQRINNTILVDKKARVLNLKELIEYYIEHRHATIINIANFELEKVLSRKPIVEGLLFALPKIDDIIKIIREAKDPNESETKLKNLLQLSRTQIKAIMDLKIGRLNKLDQEKLKSELAILQKKEKELKDLIENPKSRENQMKTELTEIKNKFGDERRTLISSSSSFAAENQTIERIKVFMYENGSIFATQKDFKDLDLRSKYGELNKAKVSCYIEVNTDQEIVVFTNDGTMQKIPALTLSKEQIEDNLLPAVPLAATTSDSIENKEYVIFFTSAGLVKKTKSSEYAKSKTGSRTIKLKGDQVLINVGFGNNQDFVAILDEKLAFFSISKISATSILTIGSKGIAGGLARSAVVLSKNDKIFMLSDEGKAKLTELSDLVETSKGGQGQVVADNTIKVLKASNQYLCFNGNRNVFVEKNLAIKSKTSIGSQFYNDVIDVISIV